MAENVLVSVIIPVYKVEKYIDQCVNSVLNQTYTNIEIILVDDGSTDNCGAICDEYAKKDKRINVIHKQNGGLSDARNYGLKAANGNYITYIDSDDVVSTRYLERMLSLLDRYNADVVQINYTKNLDDFDIIDNSGIKEFSKEEAFKNLLWMKDVKEASWGKLYKKEVAKKVYFPVGRLYEDVLTAYQFVYYSNRFICDCKSNLYYYRPNPAGIMHKKISIKRFSVLTVSNEIKQFLGDDFSKYKSDWCYYSMRHMINVYNECIVEKGDIKFAKQMEKIRVALIKNQKSNLWRDKKYSFLIYLLRLNKNLYKYLVLKMRKNWK